MQLSFAWFMLCPSPDLIPVVTRAHSLPILLPLVAFEYSNLFPHYLPRETTQPVHITYFFTMHVWRRMTVDLVPELSVGLFSSTQPNPYPTEPPYIEEQLACRKKISFIIITMQTPMHSITSITVILGLHATPTNKFNWFNFLGWQSRFQTHDPTQPTINTNFRPIPDPTQLIIQQWTKR